MKTKLKIELCGLANALCIIYVAFHSYAPNRHWTENLVALTLHPWTWLMALFFKGLQQHYRKQSNKSDESLSDRLTQA